MLALLYPSCGWFERERGIIMAVFQESRRSPIGKHVAHDEIFELGIVGGSRGQPHLAAKPLRDPLELVAYVLADDFDHPAHHCDADVAVAALADVDELPCVAGDVLVEAEE